MHPLHVLTPLTGREAAEKRTVVIGTVELNWRHFIVLASATVPALIATAFTWPFLSQYAVLVFPTVMIAASMLFYRRSNKGMRLRTYQTFMDKKKARDIGQFYLCGEPIDIASTHFKQLLHNTVPYKAEERQNDPLVATAAVSTKTTRRGDGHTFNGAVGRGEELVGTRSLRDLAPRRRHHSGEDVVIPAVLPETPTPVVAPGWQEPVVAVSWQAPVAVMERPAPAAAPTTPEPAPASPVTSDPFAARTPDGDFDHDDIDPAAFFDSSGPGRRKRT